MILAVLAVTLLVATLLGALARRLGQPAVLGELLAGVVLGGGVLRLYDPANPILHALAEFGVIVLLFEIGLHTDLRSLRRVGGPALTVAVVGVVLPCIGGFGVSRLLGVATIPALVIGAALTATSIGISARVLSDLGQLQTPEGQIVLGAAVLDDVIGLVLLAVVSSIIAGGGARAVHGSSAMIIGAFVAGLLLHRAPRRQEMDRIVAGLGACVVPIFFASVGAAVELHALATPTALLAGGALIVIGVLSKIAAGYAPWWFQGDKLLIGIAMVPRGEVGLIFAQMGLVSRVISAELFGALMLMVVVTTFLTPPLLGRIVCRRRPV